MGKVVCKCNVIHHDMVKNVKPLMQSEDIFFDTANFFKVLGDKTRVKILYALDDRELCVCDIAYLCNMTKSAISHQLALLKKEKFVKARKDGKEVFYSLEDEHVKYMLENSMNHIKEKSDKEE